MSGRAAGIRRIHQAVAYADSRGALRDRTLIAADHDIVVLEPDILTTPARR